MKQLTRDEAIRFAESKAYEGWTHEQICDFQLFQKKMCMPFGIFHEALEKTLARPVFTHELGLNYDGICQERLGLRPAPTFEEIVGLIPEEKRSVIFVDGEPKEPGHE